MFLFFYKMGHSWPLFHYFRLFDIVYSKQMFKPTSDLWSRKQPFNQLSHNYCPSNVLVSSVTSFHFSLRGTSSSPRAEEIGSSPKADAKEWFRRTVETGSARTGQRAVASAAVGRRSVATDATRPNLPTPQRRTWSASPISSRERPALRIWRRNCFVTLITTTLCLAK